MVKTAPEIRVIPIRDLVDLSTGYPGSAAVAGNTLYLAEDLSGLTRAAVRCLLLTRPILVRPQGDKMLPIANLRTVAIAKSLLSTDESILVSVVPDDPELETALPLWDRVASPLLDALDTTNLLDHVVATNATYSPDAVRALWPDAAGDAGLGRLLQVSRMTIHRARKRAPKQDGSIPSAGAHDSGGIAQPGGTQ